VCSCSYAMVFGGSGSLGAFVFACHGVGGNGGGALVFLAPALPWEKPSWWWLRFKGPVSVRSMCAVNTSNRKSHRRTRLLVCFHEQLHEWSVRTWDSDFSRC